MTRVAMTGPTRLRRYLSRPDWLLAAAALVVMLSTGVPGGSWQLPAAGPRSWSYYRGCR